MTCSRRIVIDTKMHVCLGLFAALVSIHVAAAFTSHFPMKSLVHAPLQAMPASHKLIKRKQSVLRMVDDDSSLLEEGLRMDAMESIAASFVEPNVVLETIELANQIEDIVATTTDDVDYDIARDVADDIAKDVVIQEMTVADFLTGQGVQVVHPSTQDEVMDVDETIGAILAASSKAAAAAEATLTKEVSDRIPLIPKRTSNDTFSVPQKPSILSAVSVVGEPITLPEKVEAPDVRKILKFAIPAIGVWLCSPLLSLIDTSAVGLLSGTAQQAALNPAVAVTDYAALLIAFMYTGTTNLVASAQEKDRGVEGKPRTTKNLIAALQLSGFVGAGLGTILFVFARQLLRAIIGNDGISPEVFGAAMKYVRIRALGMPAAAIIGSSQAACLGMQDIKSPLYVLLAAAIVNFFGDMLFVGNTNPWIGGAAGAAWATVFSQFAAVTLFVNWLCHKPKRNSLPQVVNLTKSITELMGAPLSIGETRRKKLSDNLKSFGKSEANKVNRVSKIITSLTNRLDRTNKPPKESSFSTRGFLEGKFKGRDFFKLPSKDQIADFAPYLVPVTSTQVGRVSGYVAMSHVVSSSLGTVSMAAQQVIVSLFYCLCPIADSLSLTAQSFLPSIVEKQVSKERADALRKTLINFWKAGAVFGGTMVGAVLTIPFLSQFFTSDPAVVSLVNMVAPLLVGIVSVHGVLCASEGVLLGQKDLAFLGKAYAGYFFVVPYLMLRVKKAALSGASNVNLTSVWKVFLSYQMFRAVYWVARTTQLQRRAYREVEALQPPLP